VISITKEQQQALDDALVPREQRLTIGSCNYRLSTTFKPKEPTFQVALDVLTLTPFYPAFLITASVPAVYMQEFWATVTYQKHNIRFKMNKKSYSFDMETFRNMLLICPKLPGQKFVDPPFEEEILTFIRELGYPGNIKLLSDVKVDTLPQPWRTFGTIINKCLSGKVTRIDTLRLSRAQILWGLYHQEKVDYVYLLWEDLVFQIENKESRKNKYMFYPRFTKVIINHFMSQDQSIPRRNKVDWHMANDDPILTTMRFIPQHEVVQRYGAILPDYLTNPAMKESEAYKTYHDLATGKVQPKLKYGSLHISHLLCASFHRCNLYRCIMPSSRDVDHHNTAHYIPMYHRIGGFTSHEREIYKSLVNRLFHEGRVVLPDFLESEPNLRTTFAAIGFDCLLNVNEQIYPIFVLQFYKSVRLIRNLNGTLCIGFVIDNVEIVLTLENFGRILRIPYEGACLYSSE
ncbi:hypothetical protein Tco_1253025, partial [Tanacetum coccineum]